MALLVAVHLISLPDRSRPRHGGAAFDQQGQPVQILDNQPAPTGGFDYRLHAEKQVTPGAVFELIEGGASEVARLIAIGAARLPTAAEIAAYEALR